VSVAQHKTVHCYGSVKIDVSATHFAGPKCYVVYFAKKKSSLICDLLHQNESHVANTVFELADDKRKRGDIYHF